MTEYTIISNINENTIIITFINEKYLPIFNIFYDYFEKHKLNNLLVISLDNISHDYLSFRNIKTIKIDYTFQTKESFWLFRLNIINYIFKYSKKNIIHTDCDCIWFKNIYREIIKLTQYDIIGHIAFSMPKYIADRLGFVLCCGLYYIKYNNTTRHVIDKILSQSIDSNDDQVLFNHFIFENMVSVENFAENYIIVKNITLSNKIKIGIINDNVISRNIRDDLYCFHPALSQKNVNDKLNSLIIQIEKCHDAIKKDIFKPIESRNDQCEGSKHRHNNPHDLRQLT